MEYQPEFKISVVPEGQMKSFQDSLNSIAEELKEIKSKWQPKEPEDFLTRKQACELLKINLSTLWAWTKKKKLKSYGLSGKVYYKRCEIEAAMVEL